MECILPQNFQKLPVDTLICVLISRVVRKEISVDLCHPVCGTFFQEIHTATVSFFPPRKTYCSMGPILELDP